MQVNLVAAKSTIVVFTLAIDFNIEHEAPTIKALKFRLLAISSTDCDLFGWKFRPAALLRKQR
jgi:hypothetical protein